MITYDTWKCGHLKDLKTLTNCAPRYGKRAGKFQCRLCLNDCYSRYHNSVSYYRSHGARESKALTEKLEIFCQYAIAQFPDMADTFKEICYGKEKGGAK
jgi:hypothetical protein